MGVKKCRVNVIWCEESSTWYTDSEDLPGLTLGDDNFETLVKRYMLAAPEMLELNLGYTGAVVLTFVAIRTEMLEAV